MTAVGIDAGQTAVKAVILEDGQIVGSAALAAGGEAAAVVAERALKQAAEEAGMAVDSLTENGFIVATGSGSKNVSFAQKNAPDLICMAKAANWLYPSSKMVVDVGAEKCLALQTNNGRPINFAINDKCASGSGAFLQTVADMLQTPLEEIGPLSLKSKEALEIKSTCVVFAESEIVSLIHAKNSREDILMGVFDGLAYRIYSLMSRMTIEEEVVMVGGVAKNMGVVEALEKQIGLKLQIPENPEIAGALGAALVAQEKGEAK